jgi:RimJ/RimL family protein N-acetyltransferase
MILEGSKCILRPVSKDDSIIVYKWFNDKEIIDKIIGFRINFSLEESFYWCEKASRENNRDIKWIIESREKASSSIGFVGLYNVDLINKNAEIAIILGEREFRGRGIGEESLRLVCGFAFKYLGLNLISAQILSSNQPSLNLFRKIGFKEEGLLKNRIYRNGTWHDIVLMRLLSEEWTG